MAANSSSLCLTPECVQAASRILQNMAPNYQSIDPCEDFDTYTCGGYPARFPKEPSYTTGGEMNDVNSYILKAIIEGGYPTTSESTPDGQNIYKKLQQSFATCMDTDAVLAEADSGRVEILSQIVTLFPVEDSDYSTNATMTYGDYDAFAKVQIYLNTVGIDAILKYDISFNPEAPKTNIPLVNSAPLTLSQRETDFASYLKAILPGETAQSSAGLLAQGVAELVIQATGAFAAGSTATENLTSWSDVASIAPALAIDQVVEALVPADYEPEQAIIMYPDFYANMSDIISNTPKATIQAAILLIAAFDLEVISAISTTQSDRWRATCFPHIDQTIPWIASKFWIDAVYNKDIGEYADTVVGDVRASFRERLDKINWMTNETRNLAKEKVDKIQENIAYPQESPNALNSTDLKSFYKDLEVGTSYFNNTILWRRWNSIQTWNKLVAPTNEWPAADHAYLVNAAYSPWQNSIYFPAGILRFPLFSASLPDYITYGGFGSPAGHEITHGFDNNGRKYDADGVLRVWWDNKTTSEFEKRTECFVNQYSNYTVLADYPIAGKPAIDPSTNKTMYVDGTKTLGENIADAGGVAAAYGAWQKRMKSKPEKNLLLPGLDGLTAQQMFFVSFGQFFCHRLTPTPEALETVAADEHAPNQARNRGIMENSRGFREAFKCKSKEPVCELW
ncbi:hypothetical protein BJ170DRAFT_462683 [Xylariales sp. AK1849]|nr:hypothetical protein BJ170DRAFT_462683 [Xylariales sp. AK1849]